MLTPIKLGLAAGAAVAAAVPASVILVETFDPIEPAATSVVVAATLPKAQGRADFDDPAFRPGPTGAAAPGLPTRAAAPGAGAPRLATTGPGSGSAPSADAQIAARVAAGFDAVAAPPPPAARMLLPPGPIALGKPAPDLPAGVAREPPVPEAEAVPFALAAVDRIDVDASPADPAARALDRATPTPKPTRAATGEPDDGRVRSLIEREAEALKVPPKLALAVFVTESGLDAGKRGPDGRIGVTQVSYRIAKALGYQGSEKALSDPETNIRWGMKYLAGAYKRADGDICRTTMKFQGGHYVEKQTQLHLAYCGRVKQAMASLP
ncbi:transglycosylase SLT domain-containing protein [Prosthecomicrobium hirschii]|uniref:transglycosylase SLT domain-containing protein n=1 Tax=Prosthecodimorpha hirschii TaxID=665126 RepID=UPI00221EF2E5|nr:transglycosylase SLT domain-containing protein [Prosthecomicrobium hirschii]MCW1840245.1 transglycosylase SLT domain-containing protein [Prosthecomicrobium hirschii]